MIGFAEEQLEIRAFFHFQKYIFHMKSDVNFSDFENIFIEFIELNLNKNENISDHLIANFLKNSKSLVLKFGNFTNGCKN